MWSRGVESRILIENKEIIRRCNPSYRSYTPDTKEETKIPTSPAANHKRGVHLDNSTSTRSLSPSLESSQQADTKKSTTHHSDVLTSQLVN